MKQRHGFVSNSSSSSFIVGADKNFVSVHEVVRNLLSKEMASDELLETLENYDKALNQNLVTVNDPVAWTVGGWCCTKRVIKIGPEEFACMHSRHARDKYSHLESDIDYDMTRINKKLLNTTYFWPKEFIIGVKDSPIIMNEIGDLRCPKCDHFRLFLTWADKIVCSSCNFYTEHE